MDVGVDEPRQHKTAGVIVDLYIRRELRQDRIRFSDRRDGSALNDDNAVLPVAV